MPHLIYVSGPSCAGKTSLCNHLIRFLGDFTRVSGDSFWIEHAGNNFEDRLQKTNQELLHEISKIPSSILLDWVPSRGSFPSLLRESVKRQSISFVHIILYAPEHVLKMRKQMRDGNTELGRIDHNILSGGGTDVYSIDTSQHDLNTVLKISLYYLEVSGCRIRT